MSHDNTTPHADSSNDDETKSWDEFMGTTVDDEPPPRMTGMRLLRERGGRVVAILLAVLLVVPAAGWLVNTLVFRAEGNQVATAVPELAGAVALVTRLGCDGTAATGSGFSVDLDGIPALITNRHVVEDAAAVGLRTLDGGAGPEVTQVLLSESEDVAVLLLDSPLPATLGITNPARAGTEVRLVGFPGARPITSSGQIEASDGRRTLLTMQVGPGASGAPVVDDDGFVVAQVVARRADGSGVAIPADRVTAGIRDAVPAPSC